MVKIKKLTNIKGLLIDLDGTLYFKGNPIPGAIETLKKLREIGLKFLLFTNTDSKSPQTILKFLQDYGFTVNKDELFTPIIALKEFLTKYRNKKSFFVTTAEVEKEFQDFPKVDSNGSEMPDFVIIGDFRDNWDVNRLNLAFKFIFKGAKLLGTQGNRYFLDRKGEPVLDTGSFVKLIASAADVVPQIFGKPSKEYFLQALNKLDLAANEVIVIGDDLETDIAGATNMGLIAFLVRTGKGQFYDSNISQTSPFTLIDSLSSILEYF